MSRMTEERLQKIISRAGITSRRKAEALILAGRVSVDGRIVRELGTRADPRRSRIEIDGRRLVAEPLVYLVLHKPRGVVCTLSDPEGRPSVGDLVKDLGTRVAPVGRLDFHTSGALLLTNDGDFASALSHPRHAAPKVYVAKVKGRIGDTELWKQSIVIEGRATQPAEVVRLRNEGDKTWLRITLREGRNRQVRRLGEAAGFSVMRLARLSQAGIDTEGLLPGEWRQLGGEELLTLKRAFGVPRRPRAADTLPMRGGRVVPRQGAPTPRRASRSRPEERAKPARDRARRQRPQVQKPSRSR
jgi:23S rRNA pseudouridine2605 synthase